MVLPPSFLDVHKFHLCKTLDMYGHIMQSVVHKSNLSFYSIAQEYGIDGALWVPRWRTFLT